MNESQERNVTRYSSGVPAKKSSLPLAFSGALVVGAGAKLLGLALLTSSEVALGVLALYGVVKGLLANRQKPLPDNPIKLLKRDLNRLQFEEGLELHVERALSQLSQNETKFKTFSKLVADKFNKGEMTSTRYLTVGQNVYLLVFDKLQDITSGLEIVKTMPPDSEMRKTQIASLALLFEANDKAMKQMDTVSVGLNELKSQGSKGFGDLDALIAELEELAKRTKKYSS